MNNNNFLDNFSFIANWKWDFSPFFYGKKNLFGTQIDHFNWSKGFWKLAVSSGLQKMVKFGKWINNFYWWDIIKIIISVGKEKVQFTLITNLKQNKEVKLDLRFEIFIFSSLLPSLLPGTTLEEKLMYQFLQFEICM